MLQNKKNVFWEALIITIAIFLAGLFLGMMLETRSSNKISELYISSEVNLADASTLSKLIGSKDADCEITREKSIEFANKIYEEARYLEQIESSGKLTDSLKLLHRKYDLLRTLLWIGTSESLENCNNFHSVVYLYEYETEDIEKKAKQNVWSRILFEEKGKNKNLILIPIAVDQDITSLNFLLSKYDLTQFPSVLIDNKDKFFDQNELQKALGGILED